MKSAASDSERNLMENFATFDDYVKYCEKNKIAIDHKISELKEKYNGISEETKAKKKKKQKIKSQSDKFEKNEITKSNTNIDTSIKYDIDGLIIEEDFDNYLMTNIIQDRNKGINIACAVQKINDSDIKDNSIIDSMRDRLVKITCYGFDLNIAEECIDRFSRTLHCKSWIVDDCLINKGMDILDVLLVESGYLKYSSLCYEMKDTVKSNIIINLDVNFFNESSGNFTKTFNIRDSTKSRLKEFCYKTGCSESGLAHLCSMIAMCFSVTLLKNVTWFKKNYVLAEHDFVIKKALKSFISQKTDFKRSLVSLPRGIINEFIMNIYKIDKQCSEKPDFELFEETVRIYSILRKADRFKMVDSKAKLILDSNKGIIKTIKKALKDHE